MLAVILIFIVGTILLIGPNANKAFSNALARFSRSRPGMVFGDDSHNQRDCEQYALMHPV